LIASSSPTSTFSLAERAEKGFAITIGQGCINLVFLFTGLLVLVLICWASVISSRCGLYATYEMLAQETVYIIAAPFVLYLADISLLSVVFEDVGISYGASPHSLPTKGIRILHSHSPPVSIQQGTAGGLTYCSPAWKNSHSWSSRRHICGDITCGGWAQEWGFDFTPRKQACNPSSYATIIVEVATHPRTPALVVKTNLHQSVWCLSTAFPTGALLHATRYPTCADRYTNLFQVAGWFAHGLFKSCFWHDVYMFCSNPVHWFRESRRNLCFLWKKGHQLPLWRTVRLWITTWHIPLETSSTCFIKRVSNQYKL
jgi:hypothetical protein